MLWSEWTIKMRFDGLIIGVVTFLLIGLFHPLVIKGEYFFGPRVNIAFVVLGVIMSAVSVLTPNFRMSILSAVVACCSFWSIKEVYEQEERVLKGWFPMNPKREAYYHAKRPVKR